MNKFIITGIILIFTSISFSFGQYGKWTELKPLHSPPPRANFGMADIGVEKAIIFGGISLGEQRMNDTWIYDFKTNDWIEITTEPKPSKRFDHRLARISENKVLLFGGFLSGYYHDTWIFDLDLNKWFSMNPTKKPTSRAKFALSQIENNKVMLYSGWVPEYDYPFGEDTWIYDLEKNEWDSIITINVFSLGSDMACAMIDSGKVIVFSGWAGYIKESMGIFDIDKSHWNRSKPQQIATPVASSFMANIDQNQVILFGGSGNGDDKRFLNETWLFSLNDTTWKPVSSLSNIPRGRASHGMAKLSRGKIIIFGGSTTGQGDESIAGDTWLFELDSSFIDVLENQNQQPELKTYINTNNELILDYYLTESGKTEIEIFNLQGFSIFKEEAILTQSGWNREIMPVENLPVGVYFVRVRAGSLNLVGKFLVF